MRALVSFLTALLFVTLPPAAHAQDAPDSATDILSEEVQLVLENMIGVSIDRQLRIADIGGDNVGVGILHRTSDNDSDGELRGLIHAYITEVYVMLSGSGTLVTGGEIVERGELSEGSVAIGPSYQAEVRGGRSRLIEVGDIVIIPAGVFHAWTSIPDHVTYLSVRVDPDQHLPAGYENPELN